VPSATVDRKSISVAKWVAATALVLFGIVLLVAGKIAAGTAVVCSALVMTLPLGRLVTKARTLLWIRTVSVAILLAAAASSIATTDIKPNERVTGFGFADKLVSLVRDFGRTVSGKGDEAEQGATEISQETVERLTQCLREHGLPDLPDPRITEDGISFEFSKVNESPEVIRAAQNACNHIVQEGNR